METYWLPHLFLFSSGVSSSWGRCSLPAWRSYVGFVTGRQLRTGETNHFPLQVAVRQALGLSHLQAGFLMWETKPREVAKLVRGPPSWSVAEPGFEPASGHAQSSALRCARAPCVSSPPSCRGKGWLVHLGLEDCVSGGPGPSFRGGRRGASALWQLPCPVFGLSPAQINCRSPAV